MGGARPWQIVLVVVGFLGFLGSVMYSCSTMGDGVDFAESITLVDVQTGELFEAPLPKRRAVGFPGKNPISGAESLYPVSQEGGKWFTDSRYLEYWREKKSDYAAVTDWRSGEVKVVGETPARADIFSSSTK